MNIKHFLNTIDQRLEQKFNEDVFKRVSTIISHLFFAILLFWSIVFFKERVLPYDGAWYCFNLINFKTFFFPHDRWGLAPVQIPALLAIKQGWALKQVLIIYSSTLIVFNYIIFLIIRYVYKNIYASFALLLALCLTYRYTFFFSPSDINPAIGPSILLYTVINYSLGKQGVFSLANACIAILLSIWLANIHLVFFTVIIFILGFVFIDNSALPNKSWWFISIGGILVFFLKLFMVKEGSYQDEKIPEMNVFIEQLPHIHQLASAKFFFFFSIRNYLPFYLTLIGVIIYGISLRKFLSTLFIFLFLIAFIILVIITYYKGEAPIMQETYYILLGLFVAIPFVNWVVPNLAFYKRIVIIILLLAVNLNAIFACKSQVDKRNVFIRNLIEYGRENNTPKMLIAKKNFDNDVVWSDWDLGFESLFSSLLDENNNPVTFASQFDSTVYPGSLNDPNIIIGPVFQPIFNVSELNKDYFQMTPSKYFILNHFNEVNSDLLMNKIKMEFVEKHVIEKRKGCYVGKTFQILRLTNNSDASIPSKFHDQDGLYLSYRIFKNDSTEYKKMEFNLSPVLKDLLPNNSNNELLVVKIPNRSGTYTINASLYWKKILIANSNKLTLTVK